MIGRVRGQRSEVFLHKISSLLLHFETVGFKVEETIDLSDNDSELKLQLLIKVTTRKRRTWREDIILDTAVEFCFKKLIYKRTLQPQNYIFVAKFLIIY